MGVMTVLRVLPDLTVSDIDRSAAFYRALLGVEVVMNHGWVAILAEQPQPVAEILLVQHDLTAPVNPVMSVEVDDVDAAHAAAVAVGAEIVYPLTDEEWGVRRFFIRDPDGNVINVLGHR